MLNLVSFCSINKVIFLFLALRRQKKRRLSLNIKINFAFISVQIVIIIQSPNFPGIKKTNYHPTQE
jgi:hypothetical protein